MLSLYERISEDDHEAFKSNDGSIFVRSDLKAEDLVGG